MGFLIGLSRNLTRFTALVILLASAVAFIGPASFAWVKGDVQVLVLGIIMLGMGMTLGREDYRILAQRPLDVFIGAAAQYTVMPLLAIGIAKLFDLSPGLTLGLVLVGTCPGGVSSNIMSFLAKGDVAFSVGMTTVSTVLAPAVTPLWMTCLVGQTVVGGCSGLCCWSRFCRWCWVRRQISCCTENIGLKMSVPLCRAWRYWHLPALSAAWLRFTDTVLPNRRW